MWQCGRAGTKVGLCTQVPSIQAGQGYEHTLFWNTRRTLFTGQGLDFSKNQLTILLVLQLTQPSSPQSMAAPKVDPVENRRRMEAGELYYCFTPELIAERRRAFLAYSRFNKAEDVSRRESLELLKEYIHIPLQIPESIPLSCCRSLDADRMPTGSSSTRPHCRPGFPT